VVGGGGVGGGGGEKTLEPPAEKKSREYEVRDLGQLKRRREKCSEHGGGEESKRRVHEKG